MTEKIIIKKSDNKKMTKQNIRSEKVSIETIKKIDEDIFEVLMDVWLNAEGIDERVLEHKTYLLMEKIKDKLNI